MSSGLYNEGLFREGLLRTTNLVRPGLITQFDTLEEALTRFAVNGVEAALALDFIASEYRTANTSTTFADAFTGNSPKLTYSTAAGSNSTMVNSAGNIVWAPHNLVPHSEDFSQWGDVGLTLDSSTATDPLGGSTAYTYSGFSGATNNRLSQIFSLAVGVPSTLAIWLKGTAGETIELELDTSGSPENTITFTGDWQLETIFNSNPTIGRVRIIYRLGNTADVVSVWGAHIYRSDLGGMAQVPGAVGDFQYYVPTNGSAEYLPRVGHHVYNGSAWVNEGLLIESEPRTNLVTYSEDFSHSSWTKNNTATLSLDATGPDGQANSAVTLVDSNATGAGTVYIRDSVTVSTATTYTFSVLAKADQLTGILLYLGGFTTPANDGYYFDLQNGVVDDPYLVGTGLSPSIEDYGNGWYRCSLTFTTDASDTNGTLQLYVADLSGTPTITVDLDGTSSILIYGAQLELGSTPSSYMPTSGGTYTRTAQSLTVPPAEFGWPTPEYIGPELVVDGSGNWIGDFDVAADVSEWTAINNATITHQSASGRMRVANGATGRASAEKTITTTVGNHYRLTFDGLAGTAPDIFLYVGTVSGGANVAAIVNVNGTGLSLDFTAESTTTYLQLLPSNTANGRYVEFDNISVREINPLSVSIQMDGRMTYADDDTGASATFVTAGSFVTGTTYVIETVGTTNFTAIGAEANTVGTVFTATGAGSGDGTALPMTAQLAKWGGVGMALDTHDTATGGFVFTTEDGNTEYVETSDTALTPGINVPFNISSRHGSTFINGAVDGVALTEVTTPTALPDLSNTDLQIAYDFMGTIGQFRQFAGDIGDTGLVTATNPSTEPTLSLTFDGTGGSFYNLSWSE